MTEKEAYQKTIEEPTREERLNMMMKFIAKAGEMISGVDEDCQASVMIIDKGGTGFNVIAFGNHGRIASGLAGFFNKYPHIYKGVQRELKEHEIIKKIEKILSVLDNPSAVDPAEHDCDNCPEAGDCSMEELMRDFNKEEKPQNGPN